LKEPQSPDPLNQGHRGVWGKEVKQASRIYPQQEARIKRTTGERLQRTQIEEKRRGRENRRKCVTSKWRRKRPLRTRGTAGRKIKEKKKRKKKEEHPKPARKTPECGKLSRKNHEQKKKGPEKK